VVNALGAKALSHGWLKFTGMRTSKFSAGERMTDAIKKFFTSGTRTVSSYDKSPYPVEISPSGSVAVDPKTLLKTKVVQDHIKAVGEIRQQAERTKKQ
jgi:hypothetical protein